MNAGGQSALFDAFLFFVIALVASAAVLSYAALSLAPDEAAARTQGLQYAEDLRIALMRTTLRDAWYLNAAGERIDLGQGVTVEVYLIDEIRLIAQGLSPENFEGTNAEIRGDAESLVRPPFSVGVSGKEVELGSPLLLWIGSGTGPPVDRFTAEWTYDTFDGHHVEVGVHLWYA